MIYDNPSPAVIAANDAEIDARMKAMMRNGASWRLSNDPLHISKPIVFPNVWEPRGAADYRAVPFAIRGDVNSSIVWHGNYGEPSVIMQPNYPANQPGHNVRWALEGVSLDGGGLKITEGGKFITLRDLRIFNCKLGLDVRNFDGGLFDDVYIRECAQGAQFDTCSLLQFNRFTIRECGDGLFAKSCNAWSGQIYCESNTGWQASFDGFRRSNLSVWFEDTGKHGFRPLVKRRNCQHNVFTGSDQDGQIYDDDAVSAACNKTLTNECEWPPLGTRVGAPTVFQVYSGKLWMGVGTTIICEPGCFQQGSYPQGELQGFDDSFQVEWKAGDYAQIRCTIVADEQTRKWCGDRQPFFLNMAGGTFPEAKRAVRLMGERTEVVCSGMAPSDGKGIRLFATLLTNGQPEQADELRFGIEGAEVRLLHNAQ